MSNNLQQILTTLAKLSLVVFAICVCIEFYFIREHFANEYDQLMLEQRIRTLQDLETLRNLDELEGFYDKK